MLSKDKKRTATEPGTISTLLGRDVQIEGTLSFKETIRVDGMIKGQLVSSQDSVLRSTRRPRSPAISAPLL
jgi:cytoskeletal protein CcmA (bactofilin family)